MKKFLLIVTLFSVICNGCYELDFDTDFHSGIYEKRYSRIYYTTSDNRPIELDTSLENREVSNTYSNGQGVLVFEDIVTEIESYTFYYCENLTSLKIPDSVTKIGDFAFTGCNRLEKIYIPNSVTKIGDSAFKYCSSLTSVYISDLSAWCRISFENYPSNPLYYAKNLYLNNKLVTYLVIPSDITEIKSYAFCKCSCLTSITIPDSVTTIGKYAFEGCSSLISVDCKATTPPTGGSYMFNGNASGRKIYVPRESVETYKSAKYWSNYADAILGYDFENGEIEGFMMEYTSTDGNKVTPYSSAFDAQLIGNYCINGKGYLYFDREITKIGIEAFYNCKNLNNITIPDSVTTIGSYAFKGCSSLTSVTIPDSVTTIGNYAFYGCTGELVVNCNIPSASSSSSSSSGAFYGSKFTSVTIGDSVTTIGEDAFWGCSSLTSVTIGDSVTTIGGCAFAWCSSLTSVTIGDSVTTIGNNAFCDCSSLTSVYCKATTPPTGGSYMFNGNASGRKIYVTMESVESYKSAEGWSNYADAIVGYEF